ncbi:TNT domain-containing protein [Acrocarpospora phusangensis]|uniref:TNT domain-containing protein n=1 Tax=Acrocarpospora phusangensis TaxID=1070424 RepID=UPI001950D052|nr:TNT domain-containing protein [Acrocarpospora phusangensis]
MLSIAAIAIGAGAFASTPAHASASPPPAPTAKENKATSSQSQSSSTTVKVDRVEPPAKPPVPAVPVVVCGPPYVLDNSNLGPKYLPKTGNLGRILKDYVGYGGLQPGKFLYRYWNEQTNMWRYPDAFGFARPGDWPNARPLVYTGMLPVGMLLDRFGGEGGAFLAPYGTPYEERALPPSNLNTFPGDPHICNYHVYRVTKQFQVDAGPASRAFQMEGMGKQYHTMAKYIPGATANADGEVSINWLASNGYLERVN